MIRGAIAVGTASVVFTVPLLALMQQCKNHAAEQQKAHDAHAAANHGDH